MRIQPPIQIEFASTGESTHLFSGLDPGDTMTVAFCSAAQEGNTALFNAQGQSFKASLPHGVQLLEGDTLTLLLTERQNGRLFFKLLTVNGQNVFPEAGRLEQSLIKLGIPPGERNIHLARFLRQSGYDPSTEMIGDFEKVIAKAPGLPDSVAAFMAARGLLPGEKETGLFSRPGQLPDKMPGETAMQNFYYQNIPVRFRDQTYKAGLFVFSEKDRRKAKKNQTVVFLALQTQNMGKIEARLKYDAGGLTADFFLCSGSVQEYFLNHLDVLKEALSETMLRLLFIRASVVSSPNGPAAADDPGGSFRGGIDIQI